MKKFKLVPIKSVRKEKYIGKVYDLTVEHDHSYNVYGIICHNSICSTREKSGIGIPLFTNLIECNKIRKTAQMIADGGMSTPGDVCKAIAAGADFVIMGSRFAGCKESPAKIIEQSTGNGGFQLMKSYSGAASYRSKERAGMKLQYVEGVSMFIHFTGGVKFTVYKFLDGLRSSMSYIGANTLEEYHSRIVWPDSFLIQTNAGQMESYSYEYVGGRHGTG